MIFESLHARGFRSIFSSKTQKFPFYFDKNTEHIISKSDCFQLFLHINLFLFSRDQEVYISGNNRHRWISLTDLPLPSFLRFDNVQLWYGSSSAPISEKCEVAESHLRSFKHALNDTNMLEFSARISDSNDDFRDHLLLLDHLRDRVLPICDSSRCYKFEICFYLEERAIANLIASILQQSAINLCTNVCIRIHHGFGQQQLFLPFLPIEEISNWLHQMSDHGKELIQAEKFLDVKMLGIQNVAEMVEYLKMVYFNDILNGILQSVS